LPLIISLIYVTTIETGTKNYFLGFIGSLQHMMSQASTQPQTVSTETTSPQARQANLLPFVTAFFFVGVVFFAGTVFFVFVAISITPFIQAILLKFSMRVRFCGLATLIIQ